MKKATLALLCALAAMFCMGTAQAVQPFASSSSTSGLDDERPNQALVEEFAKCSAFNTIAAKCARNNSREQGGNAAAQYEDTAKRFRKGGYMLAGQGFTMQRIQFHETAMRRNAGSACEGYPKLEQQYRKRCDGTFKHLPRKLQAQ